MSGGRCGPTPCHVKGNRVDLMVCFDVSTLVHLVEIG